MPRMTNAKTAPVLDSADVFEQKLRWILFKQDQEAVLYGGQAYNEWRPGDPLYRRPSGGHYRDVLLPGGEYQTAGGQWCRPMVEEFDAGMEAVETSGYMLVDGSRVRCEPCETGWTGDEPCFSCGEYRPRPRLTHYGEEPVPHTLSMFGGAVVPSDILTISVESNLDFFTYDITLDFGYYEHRFQVPRDVLLDFDEVAMRGYFYDMVEEARQEAEISYERQQEEYHRLRVESRARTQRLMEGMRAGDITEFRFNFDAAPFNEALQRMNRTVADMREPLQRTSETISRSLQNLDLPVPADLQVPRGVPIFTTDLNHLHASIILTHEPMDELREYVERDVRSTFGGLQSLFTVMDEVTVADVTTDVTNSAIELPADFAVHTIRNSIQTPEFRMNEDQSLPTFLARNGSVYTNRPSLGQMRRDYRGRAGG